MGAWATYSVGCAGVGHGVTSVAVGDILVDERTLASGGVFLSVLDGSLDSEYVHAVDLQTGNVLATLVVVGEGGGAVRSGTHTVLVVYVMLVDVVEVSQTCLRTFTTEDDGQVPELRHVVCLENLTLVGSTVSVQSKGNVLLVLVLACECNTSANGDLSTDDTVSTVESGSEHVHRSTLSVRNALSPAEQFADDGLDGSSAHEGEAVAAVGGDEMVLAVDCVLNSNGDSFLSSRQMAETPDLLLLVESVGGHFHASAQTCQIDLVPLGASCGASYRTATMS
jgi:hypothetical protein